MFSFLFLSLSPLHEYTLNDVVIVIAIQVPITPNAFVFTSIAVVQKPNGNCQMFLNEFSTSFEVHWKSFFPIRGLHFNLRNMNACSTQSEREKKSEQSWLIFREMMIHERISAETLIVCKFKSLRVERLSIFPSKRLEVLRKWVFALIDAYLN